jgi:mRNA interferase RelE/StbE
MRYQIRYLPGAEKDLRSLPSAVAQRARRGIERLADDPRAGKPLVGELAPFWSYRVGDYRIVYEIRQEEIVVLIVMVGNRRDVYEKARRRR